MSEFRTVPGFDDVWRPAVAARRTAKPVLAPMASGAATRARLARVVSYAPEVMVKVTGRTRDAGHLRAHLDYISRHGRLEIEDRDGALLAGRREVGELAEDWAAMTQLDSRRRANTPFSLSVVLSMPAGVEPRVVRDAARAFAETHFAERFDYAFVLHTDTARPHVHLAIRSLGEGGRLNPNKADLEAWRQTFAQALRDRGVEAEATPRRARGVARKSERTSLRKMRERHEAGRAAPVMVRRMAYRDAARTAFQGNILAPAWEARLVERQSRIRSLYRQQARLLRNSVDPKDRSLGAQVEDFVRTMPRPESLRQALVRELLAVNERLRRQRGGADRYGPMEIGPDRPGASSTTPPERGG